MRRFLCRLVGVTLVVVLAGLCMAYGEEDTLPPAVGTQLEGHDHAQVRLTYTVGSRMFKLYETCEEGPGLVAVYWEKNQLSRFFVAQPTAPLHDSFGEEWMHGTPLQFTVDPVQPVLTASADFPRMSVTLDFTQQVMEISYRYIADDFPASGLYDDPEAGRMQRLAVAPGGAWELWEADSTGAGESGWGLFALYNRQTGQYKILDRQTSATTEAHFLDDSQVLVIDFIKMTLYDTATGKPSPRQLAFPYKWDGREYWPLGAVYYGTDDLLLVPYRRAGWPEDRDSRAKCFLAAFNRQGQLVWAIDTGLWIPNENTNFIAVPDLRLEGNQLHFSEYQMGYLGSVTLDKQQ